MSHDNVTQTVSSYPIFEKCKKLIDPGDKKPLEEYILKLSPAEYKTFIILAHSLEVFTLRGIKDEPMFEKQGNLFRLYTKQLQVLYHDSKDLDESMVKHGIEQTLFVEAKEFKVTKGKDRSWEKKMKVSRINCRYLQVPILDPQVEKIEVRDAPDFYQGQLIDNKFPIISVDDPQVILLGAKRGQVIVYYGILYDQLPYHEIHCRVVDYLQNKFVNITQDGEERDEAAFEIDTTAASKNNNVADDEQEHLRQQELKEEKKREQRELRDNNKGRNDAGDDGDDDAGDDGDDDNDD